MPGWTIIKNLICILGRERLLWQILFVEFERIDLGSLFEVVIGVIFFADESLLSFDNYVSQNVHFFMS